MSLELIKAIIQAKAEAATDAYPDLTGKPYRPSSGSEGMGFDSAWCDHCARDAKFRSNPDADPAIGCQIIADTFAFEIDDPRYPKEWVYGRDGRPCCTAYTEDPTCPRRCNKTIDLFGK